jgi:predicted double-glycine peptidase
MRTQKVRRCLLAITMLILSGCSQNYGPNMLNVVDIRQSTSYTCGVASAQAILNYYGIDEGEDQLAEEFGTTEANGTSPSQIIAGLESYGLTATLKENTTLDDLRANITNKIPTMVAIQAWLDTYPAPDWNTNWENGHWVIVIGLDDQKVYFEDPLLLGTRGWLTQAEFLARWHDYSGAAPCCDANDQTWTYLSISVQGPAVKGNLYTHID